MPELPEVEVVKKSLNRSIHHLTIKNIEILNKNLRYKIDIKLIKKIIKSKVLRILRRSKYILILLNNNYTILAHLGMTGKFIIVDNKNIRKLSSFYFKIKDHKSKHDHIVFEFSKRIKLIYNDVRKFGFIKIEKTKNLLLNSHLIKLGPEPLSPKFDVKYFKSKIKRKKIFLKDLLMNQKFVAGLGNIYVNEVIFLSRLNPKKKVCDLSAKNISDLIRNIKKVLKKAIKEGGSSIKDFIGTKGENGNFQQFFNVYGKKDENCNRINCNGKIKKLQISNRSTFFCNSCQKL